MSTRNLIQLSTLGMLWGISFLFIKLAVAEFGSVALMCVRVMLAAAVLLPLVFARRQLVEIRRHARSIFMMGVLHYAIPFTLFAWAMQTLPAGYASVINATSPLFAGTVAWIWLGERPDFSRISGLVVGFSGVVLLLWGKLAHGDGTALLDTSAAVAAAFFYGLAAVLAKKQLAGVNPIAVAGGSMVAASLVLLPVSFFLWPTTTPSAQAWSMAALLGVVCTALAFVLYFRLIEAVGPVRAITVTFLVPVFTVAFGAMLLHEPITTGMIVSGVVIALGTALSTGSLRLSFLRRWPRVLSVRALIITSLLAWPVTGISQNLPSTWDFSAPVYFSTSSFYRDTAQGKDSFHTLSGSLELEWTHLRQQLTLGFFAEHYRSGDKRVDGTTLAGIWGAYRMKPWDFTGWWYGSRFPDSPTRPTLMGRLRREIRPGMKLGLEYSAFRSTQSGAEMKLVLYYDFNNALSMKLRAGRKTGGSKDLVARIDLSWRFH